jgi:hypothetical protein
VVEESFIIEERSMRSVYIWATLFEVLRWTNLGFYRDIEQQYAQEGINISIDEVSVVPLEIEGDCVKYLVTATDYKYVGLNDRQLVRSDIDD